MTTSNDGEPVGIISDVAHATAFLTRLPVPTKAFGGAGLDFSRQTWTFPLVAVPLALIAGAIGMTGSFVGIPLIGGILVAAALVITTGALHEDGLADCADGFWGGHERQRRLTIMRDSSVGAYGVLALVTIFSLRAAAFGAFLAATGMAFGLFVLAALAFGRTALVLHWNALPAAIRAEGGVEGASLSSRFGSPDRRQAGIAIGVLTGLLVPVVAIGAGAALVVAITIGSLFGLAATLITRAKIGGHTGDTLGATALLSETGFLLGLLVLTVPA